MFELTLFDHLRMTFGHIVHRHRAHAELAQSRRRWDRALRIAEVLLMTGVVVSRHRRACTVEVTRSDRRERAARDPRAAGTAHAI